MIGGSWELSEVLGLRCVDSHKSVRFSGTRLSSKDTLFTEVAGLQSIFRAVSTLVDKRVVSEFKHLSLLSNATILNWSVSN